MRDILNGERDLTELDEANGNLLEELGQLKHESSEDIVSHKQEDNSEESSVGLSSKGQARVSSSSKQGQQLKPFERSPDRDPIGPRNKNESEEKDHENAEDSIETEDESEEWEQGVEDEDTDEIAS